ncbi:MAG TPA: bifunctional 2-polyprenyl-6-hydroxyphenol methylase/3-demethylubiquinol 3-O-methyltransferase UbiG [Acetobacteraceae bacterium]
MGGATVSAKEVARFDALAANWWDPNGPMRPLHRMNPARIGWIRQRIGRHFPDTAGLRLLDVGCGAGLASEALAHAGFTVLGLDAAGEAIEAARAHARGQALPMLYRAGLAEDLASEGLRFPVITALEVIEHVPDPAAFLRVLASLLEPQGLLFLSTLNRTTRSFVTAKLGAEYVLRWLPAGTHDWRKFLTPAELGTLLREAGLRVSDSVGLMPSPLRGGWRTGADLRVNYMIAAEG